MSCFVGSESSHFPAKYVIKFFIFYFIFSFIFISQRLITLQYCSGFCPTLTWISHGFTCVPHPHPCSRLLLHPIPLGLPSAPALSLVSCIQAGLAICFTLDNIHVLMLFSLNIPPSPSPTEDTMKYYMFFLSSHGTFTFRAIRYILTNLK